MGKGGDKRRGEALGGQSRSGIAWLLCCLIAALALGLGAPRRPAGTANLAAATAARSPRTDAASADPRTIAIDELDLCDRVRGINPLGAEVEPEPDPETWKTVELRLPDGNSDFVEMRFVREPEWFEENEARAGGTVYLELPEFGVEGEAEVTAIGPCPPLKPGKGAVVTGTFRRRSHGNLVSVMFEGDAEPTIVTDNHPYFSEDRRDFVAVGELRRGENVRGPDAGCLLRFLSAARHPADELVCNIEVNGQHVYHVGPQGVLVHNACPNPWGRLGSPAHQATIRAAEARLTASGWTTISGGSKGYEEMVKSVRRFPDLVMKRNGKTIAVQVGRATKGGLPIARERRALKDLRASGVFNHVIFLRF